ncbi:site-specific integrase [Staphylococcus xylosus]|uniref:tyrosine-type recombinase/integrase n=1 Tax=Staphylococcus xylosus TaxID=1288 RepID=UPI002DBD1F00|nr:site-specific integrase [Staphylococcus xylosus]MEB7800358.1 site-specific integrase [Staphylococcus xylosus]
MYVSKLKDGKFKVTLEAPKDPVTGKRRQITRIHTKRSKAIELATLELHKRKKYKELNVKQPVKYYFYEVANDWFLEYQRAAKKSTVVNRKTALKMLFKYFYNIEIDKITHFHIQEMVNDIVVNQNKSIAYAQSIKGCLNLIFKFALKNSIILYDPTQFVTYPQKPKTVAELESDDLEMKYISTEDMNKILEVTKSNRRYYQNLSEYFLILYYTGMRPSELLALKSTDINFKNKTVSITKTLFNEKDKRNDYSLLIPKGNKKRIIKINDICIETFQKLINENKEKKKIYKDAYDNQKFIFSDSTGHPYILNRIHKKFKRILTEAEISNDYTPHAFRHTYTTNLIASGAPVKLVQQVLGHINITTTLNIYTHVTEKMEFDALSNLDSYIESFDPLLL